MTQAILKHVIDGLMCRAANMAEKRCWTSRPTEAQRKAVKWDD